MKIIIYNLTGADISGLLKDNSITYSGFNNVMPDPELINEDAVVISLSPEKADDILCWESAADYPLIVIAYDTMIPAMRVKLQGRMIEFLGDEPDSVSFKSALRTVMNFYRLKNEVFDLRNKLRINQVFNDIKGNDKSLTSVLIKLESVLDTEVNVLLSGESGTGKELFARAIHRGSRRRKGPFVAVNCAAITNELADSLLFGHRKGSFTGAYDDHAGYFEQANGGSLFLDEIGDMDLIVQAKVLRVLENRMIRRIGERNERPVDFRVISASNIDFAEALDKKHFRKDLYYRLEEYPVRIPSLSDRVNDIPLLAEHFLKEYCDFYEMEPMTINSEALSYLKKMEWPGNIRELKNLIRRAAVNSITSEIMIDDLGIETKKNYEDEECACMESAEIRGEHGVNKDISAIIPLEELERSEIEKAWRITSGNTDLCAKLLGVSRATFYRKLKKYGINHHASRK